MVFTMAYRTPSEMAKAVVESSVTKANADFASLAILGFLGGSFIALAGASAQTVSLGLGSWAGARHRPLHIRPHILSWNNNGDHRPARSSSRGIH